MSSSVDFDAPRVSPERVAAFRLSRHHLSKRAPAATLPDVTGDMAGAQAQLMSAAQISLWARTRSLRQGDIGNALWDERSLVKAWCMRGTIHLIPSTDFAEFVRGSARRGTRDARSLLRAGWDVESIHRGVEEIGRVLDRPRNRRELAQRVSESLGLALKSGAGRGWTATSGAPGFDVSGRVVPIDYLMWLAGLRGVACFGPNDGNEATFVRPDRWLPRFRDLPVEEAESELLRRYLRAFGPATLSDFGIWAYGSPAEAREIWARLADELAPVNVDGRPGWMLRTDIPAVQRAKIARPCVRLLPYFDSFVLGLTDRRHLVDAAHYTQVYRPAGWISPVVLVDGRVAGVWTMDRKRGRIGIRVEPFRRITGEERDGIEAECTDLGRFLDSPSELVIPR